MVIEKKPFQRNITIRISNLDILTNKSEKNMLAIGK